MSDTPKLHPIFQAILQKYRPDLIEDEREPDPNRTPPLDDPHASDCNHWLGERCNCIMGRL